MDINKIKSRLSSLSNTNTKNNLVWKPKAGKQVIRIVPYSHNLENPFIELKFHYNLGGKTYLSPDTFNRPDPIVEFSNKLKKSGDKDQWVQGKQLEPKMRTYVPILVRGEESEGVKFWGFGKKVYQELLSIIADPDFGDITDLKTGRDIIVEFKSAKETGKNFPDTTIRAKPNISPAFDLKNTEVTDKVKHQANIMDLYTELPYEDLKKVFTEAMNAQPAQESTSDDPFAETSTQTVVEEDAAPKSGNTEIEASFDKLFNS